MNITKAGGPGSGRHPGYGDKRDAAAEKSQKAFIATSKTTENSTAEEQQKASDLHTAAKTAHLEAAKSAKQNKSPEMERYHKALAESHATHAEHHFDASRSENTRSDSAKKFLYGTDKENYMSSKYQISDTVTAQDGSEVTLNDLQSQVSTLAQSDSRFNNKPAGSGDKSYAGIWVSDILTDGSEFKAVISAMDGKYYEVGINVADGKVTSLNTDATEVVRKTMYVASRGKGLCFNSETVEGEIKAGGPGSGPHASVAAAQHASHKAEVASRKANTSGNKGDHEKAAVAHGHAAEMHAVLMKQTGDEHDKSSIAHADMERSHENYASDPVARNELKNSLKAKDGTAQSEEIQILNCRDTGIPIVLAAGKEWKFGEATDFQWMPGGLNNIVAGTKINGEERAVDLWLDCNEATAKTVKASFAAAVKRSPRRPPFGCVEHHEEEKAFEPQDFSWKSDPEPGVYCTAKPTGLGETNVNKRLHTSFSPSFGTNADYAKAQCRECENLLHGEDACTCGGTVYFPDGVKGSESNPATVVAVSPKSVGSLTNWPAFKNILPVTAKEPGDKKTLTPMEKIYAKEAEKQKMLDEIRAKHCAPEAPKNPVMEKLYALNGMNS